ncbi:spore coat protein [Paludicola sp. MB14-C6]|uniref:spore coat protein n=1 Tax=Paludihabitans sp. MB14-C6 TaxID=3070656 RepID=UPI0027DE7F3F|nr:spore coat protein [Paludicola sp. MB14-C6]WMJ23322.1 spore coat protein [Paludicola sp. MB14-C6]
MALSNKELSIIDEQLSLELLLIKKYKMYASICNDLQLKSKYEQVAAQHLNHYNSLLNQLN